ncbi:unnamed protein product (macronuclear) [Paramecium tetraurelia]|uniref:NACHT domain-containing protein n=1 Tax=Paramecium tetraurelia TaxID=5888 RepID=A0CJ90_PARTE|nr:uncharacterized protein GSPATT00000566001 [Paramecium tetraurelia]CAK70857.1 unnamed protein product [Paramecium tetraurelia]|eukprot:XP_001438254.1 hypothetical protein (macronuclear) [Paramecium tetraurelia strain d4-2]
MSGLLDKVTSTLRGGGCGSTKTIPYTDVDLKSDIYDTDIFITRFDSIVQIISSKATVAANQSEAQEIMIAIQWFIFQEENIYKLIKNEEKVMKSYNLIIDGIQKLLKSCLIYIRTDSFKSLFILRISASLSKVIFSFHMRKAQRFINWDTQNQILDICDQLRQEMSIEKNDLIQIQLELYLSLTQTSFQMAPNNGKEREDILHGCLEGIINSIFDMKPSVDLFKSLYKGAVLLYDDYTVQKNRKQYESYFQIDILQWEIINNLKNDSQNLEEILLHMNKIHENLVKNQSNWKNHFLWIQMIGKIITYHPLITKKKLNQLTSPFNFQAKSNFMWKEYQNKGFLMQLNHSNDQALVLLNQFKNKELSQIDKLILEDTFIEWENLMLLKDFLVNQKTDNIYFTFGSYLKLKLGSIEPQKDEQKTICKIQQFLDFIISNKLLALIQENYERLGIIVKDFLNFIKQNMYFDAKIEQAKHNSQLKKINLNFKEFFQNALKIIKIIRLSKRKQNFQLEQFDQKKNNEFQIFQQIKYILRLLEQILSQAIQDLNSKKNEPNESKVMQQQLEEIQKQLQNLNLTEENFSFLNKFQQKLIALISATPNLRSFLKEAQCMLKLIEQTVKQVSELEILLLQKKSLIQYFQCLLNNLNSYYEHQIQELQNQFNELNLRLQTFLILQYEIDTVSSPEQLKEIQKKYSQQVSFQFLHQQRLNILKLRSQLITFKECFQNIFSIPSQEFLKYLGEINLDGFPLNVIQSYPKQIICCDSQIYQQAIADLMKLEITQQDYQNNLIILKGSLDLLIFQLTLEEKMIDLERIHLELIEKEFGELFEETNSLTMTLIRNFSIDQSINIIENKNLNQDQLKIERQKYEILLQQLRKINYQENCKEGEQIQLLVENVVKLLKASINQELEIFRMPIIKRINDLKVKFNELKTKYDKIKEEDKDESNNQNRKNLSIIINILQLLQIKARQTRQKLAQFFENVKNFTKSRDVLQECYEEMYIGFLSCFQNQLNQLKEYQFTTANLKQYETESSKEYFSRISINLYDENQSDQKNTQIINIVHFLYQLMAETKEKLMKSKWKFIEIQFDQEYLIQLSKILYLQENYEEQEVKTNQQDQFSKDQYNNDEWKIKQGLVLTIIQISLHSFAEKITQFCQKELIELWVQEKDLRVRNLLKNEKLISMQMQILSKDWQTQQDRIAGEMQEMLSRIDELQEQISHEANLNKRDLCLKELDETTEQLDQYIKNISEMGQQLRLLTDFVNHIRKGLIRVEGKINEMKEQLKNIGNDIKFLRGKSVEQLFEIRKWKVLKEAALKNTKSIYVPLETKEIYHKAIVDEKKEESILINLEQINDTKGEVNEFLLEEKETVLLIHGVAGSGKSTTAKKIEEFIWKLHNNNKKIRNRILIPIYISLPSLKNPVFQAVEETLHQDEYGFDDLQLKECKEMLEKNEFRLLLIMDSYDEMKLENIQKNLYMNNKVKQNWSDPLVIFTTRSEIFTSVNYALWFAPEKKENLKEVQLEKFNLKKIKQYLKKFAIQSIKMLIYELYEWQSQISNRGEQDINNFEVNWEKLFEQCLSLEATKANSEALLNQKEIDNILSFLKINQFFNLKSVEALRNLMVKLQKLWSVEKYEKMMNQINLYRLIETPYMMEIIVQVLPKMMEKASEIINLRLNFLKNFPIMLYEFYKSKRKSIEHRIIMKQNKLMKQDNRIIMKKNNRIIMKKEKQDNNEKEQQVTQTDVENLDKINYFEIAVEVWNKMEESSIAIHFQELNLNKNLFFEHSLKHFNNSFQKISILKDRMIEVVRNALSELNLTSFDFYDEFINQYHHQQIEKQRNLGKSLHIDRFLHDLKKYSINLAKVMSAKQTTQVQYQQQGFLYQEEREDEKWQNEFFNDDDHQFGSYKKDLRSCSLIKQKGNNFQFVHKSIQEFYIAADLYSVLVVSKELNKQTFNWILEQLSKENNYDKNWLEYSPHLINQEKIIKFHVLIRDLKVNAFKKNIESTLSLLKTLNKHEFFLDNYSIETYVESRKYLIQKIKNEVSIIEFLKFLVQLTAIESSFIQGGSNSLNLLVEMQIDLTNHNFEKIRIKNTSIVGGNFFQSNLNQSELTDVNINAINLNRAQMFGCKWKRIKINDIYSLDGHSRYVNTVNFSPDGNMLASCSLDKSIRLWDVKTGQQKAKLDGHDDAVSSVKFSPDGTTLVSVSSDSSIRLWDVKTGQQFAKLDGHSDAVYSVNFSPDGTTLASGSQDNSIRLWDVKTGQQKAKLDGHSHFVYSVHFSPDGTTLASGSRDFSIRFWDVRTGQQKAKLDGHSSTVTSVNFSPDGTTLASGSEDNSIRLWDVKTGQQIAKLDGHENGILSVHFSPDGTTLASGSGDNSIRLWDVKTGQQKAKLNGHSSTVTSVNFSPAIRYYRIKLWSVHKIFIVFNFMD